jgi:hypothetical protein
MLAIALVGSLVYAVYALANRDASIPLLTSGAVVLAIVFGALAVYCGRATWQAGLDRRDGRAIALGLSGGFAALAAAGCVAAAIILFQLMSPPAASVRIAARPAAARPSDRLATARRPACPHRLEA